MLKKIQLLVGLILFSISVYAQVLSPNAEAYNYPYDTLIKMGDKAISSGLILGVESPHLGMMFYNRAVEIQPDKPLAYEKKGQAYLSFSMLEEASESFTQCLDLSPDNPQCLYGIFSVSAKGTTKYGLPNVPQPMMKQVYNSAVAFLKVAPVEMAEDAAYAELLGYAFKLGLDNPEAYQKYCTILLTDQIDATAAKTAEELAPIVQTTNNNPAMASLYDKITSYYFNNDNGVKTKEFAQKALLTGYAYTATYYYLGWTLYNVDKNPTEAMKVLEEGLKKKGSFERSENLLGTIQLEEGKKAYEAKNYPAAINLLTKFTADFKLHSRGKAYLGFALYNSKKYPEAAKVLKELKKTANSANVNIHYPNLDALIAFAEKPSATNPAPIIKTTLPNVEKNEAIYYDGEKLRKQGNYDAANAKYNEALVYFTTTNDKPSMEMCFNGLGLSYHDSKNYEKAKEMYAKSIELGTSDQSSYTNYALLLFAIDGNHDMAEKILESGLARYPDNNSIYKMQGRLFISKAYKIYDTKDYAACIPYFTRGLELREDAEAYIFLGFCYNETQQLDLAIEAWDTAFYLDSSLQSTYQDVYNYVQSQKE